MKWYPPKLEKPKPCSRCRKGIQIVGKLCGFCFSSDVARANQRASKSTLRLGGDCCSRRPVKTPLTKKA